MLRLVGDLAELVSLAAFLSFVALIASLVTHGLGTA
jgi:hypothetical protein